VSDRLTLATSMGLPFLALSFHVATACVALVAGFIAIAVRKGGTWHRRSGVVFVYAMIAMGIAATGISLYEGKSTYAGGIFAAYLVFTGYTTLKPLAAFGRRLDIALMALALTAAAGGYRLAFIAFERPGHQMEGVPAGMHFFLSTIILLAAIGDARTIWTGGVHGVRRLARHLWRMSFGLFIASGSFFIGQMKFIPAPIRVVPLLIGLGVAPLLLLGYWMWRVRLRQNLRGMMTVIIPVSTKSARSSTLEAHELGAHTLSSSSLTEFGVSDPSH
jgi:hypothetical protein